MKKMQNKAEAGPAQSGHVVKQADTRTAHTPGPWIACYKSVIVESNNELIADCDARPTTGNEHVANAEFIARACNAHADLLEALRNITNSAAKYRVPNPAYVEAARAAIAKAERGQE